MDHPQIFRPTPRRAFEITPASSESSAVPTPSREPSNLSQPELKANDSIPPDRTRSILNLTSSTLFGIYEPSRHETPSGTEASIDDSKPPVIGAYERRLQRSHSQHHPTFRETTLSVVPRTMLLFAFGVAYGIIITHLHDDQRLAPVKIEGIQRYSWQYLGFWGIAGVALGGLLPWIDVLWEEALGGLGDGDTDGKKATLSTSDAEERPVSRSGSGMAADWNPAVRSVGAFIGIAFAIRKLPWQSTSQVSLTLALVNPVLWYLIDRSKPGFLLSALVGLGGTAILLGINPNVVPQPASPSPRAGPNTASRTGSAHHGLITHESIGVGTWIASVLFCSSVCFGNIGRRLALGQPGRRPSVS